MKKPLLLLLTLLFPVVIQAQIEYPGKPWSQDLKLKSVPAAVSLPGVTQQAAKSYADSFGPQLKSMVFAYPFDTLLTSDRNGSWETMPDGSRIWRLMLHSPGALSLNVIFSRFILPKNADVYLYTPDYKTIRGAFNSKNQTDTGVLPTMPVPGNTLIIEIDLPADAAFIPVLEISKVSHDFKGIMDSGYCNIDINCPAGNDWQTEKRAVVKFIRGGTLLCSGALINNTRNDGRPFLLTANHTIGNSTHASQSLFYFRYESPECGSGVGSQSFTISGSKLLATTNVLDFCLVELNQTPPEDYEPYYAGWDRRTLSYMDTVTCIHHPSGDVKKISKSFHRVVTGSFGYGYDSVAHWLISQWDVGTTEGGSSGSPLFNNDHRIVGDLTGGQASCTFNRNDYFMKFSVSWDKYSDSSKQLKYWLDPALTGLSVLNGYDPYDGGKPVANFSIRPDDIQVNRKVYFTELSTGSPVSWSWSFENGSPSNSTAKTPGPVVFSKAGTSHVTLIVSNALGTDTLKQTIAVSDYSAYSVSENRVVPERLISFSDQSSGNPVSAVWSVEHATTPLSSGLAVDLKFLNQGEYSVSEIVEYQDSADTLMHYNQIKVIPDELIFHSRSFSNVRQDEHTGYSDSSLGNQGYLPGSNNVGISAYAEAFRNTSDTIYVINGISISLAVISKWSDNYYLPFVIWNGKKQVVLRDSVMISDYQPGSRLTKWFNTPVNFDTLMYIGFEPQLWENGTFVSKMATDRGESGLNTAYIIKNNQWQPITDIAGIHTSLDLSLETSVLMNSFKEEIRILPGLNDGVFTVDLGNLVFKQVDVSVFNVKGQKIVADVVKGDNQISFKISPAVTGVYIVSLTIDSYRFATKMVILKQ